MRGMRAGIKMLVATAGMAGTLAFGHAALAEFQLNWQADGTPPPTSGGCWQFTPDCTIIEHGADLVTDQTPFVYQRVTDENGVTYYHMVVGNPDDGFAQEVYIQYGGANLFPGTATGVNLARQSSSSGGAIDPFCADEFGCGAGTNAESPLASSQALSGNATGNPSRVQMRQLLVDVDGDLTVDFVKDRFLEKPTITNIIDTGDIEATMIINGSGNLYSTPNSSQVTNTVVHRGDNRPPEASASFDMANLSEQPGSNVNLTAGQYTTTNPAAGSVAGPYIYADPRESVNLAPDWASFFDHDQANPWAFPLNRPAP